MRSLISQSRPRSNQSSPKQSRIKTWLTRFFIGMGVLFFISLIGNIVFFAGFLGGKESAEPIPDEFVLSMELSQSLPDVTDTSGLISQIFPPKTISLLDFLRAMHNAKTDDRVRGVSVRLHDGAYSLAQIETMRNAVKDFRSSGKKAIIYTDSFGGFSNGVGEYWLAAAFDEIWVQPIGIVSVNGIRIEQPFLKDALDKIGVGFEMEHRKEFKSAVELYTRSSMSDANRTSMTAIVDDIMTKIITDIAADRKMTKAAVRQTIDQSPLLPEDAHKAGLIDKIGYFDDFKSVLTAQTLPQNSLLENDAQGQRTIGSVIAQSTTDKAAETKKPDSADVKSTASSDDAVPKVTAKTVTDKATQPKEKNDGDKTQTVAQKTDDDIKAEDDRKRDIPFITVNRYKDDVKHNLGIFEKDTPVALVQVRGIILDSSEKASVTSGPNAFVADDDVADADEIAYALSEAADLKEIKVIILRVDSPGGSPSASEVIRHAVVKAKAKGKYVIVSMADYAASGGYWVSVDGNEIIASPLTLTGSIGVYGGKPNMAGLWKKLGINWGVVEYGQNAGMWSMNEGYNATERNRLNAMMDHIYQSFTARVAEGRKMDGTAVEKVAKGRAWTGLAAKDRGLVDQLGGFDTALKRAAEIAKVDDWYAMPVALMQRPHDPLEDLADMLGIPLSLTAVSPLPKELMPALIPQAIVAAPPMMIDF